MLSQVELELQLGLASGVDTALILDLELRAVGTAQDMTNRFFGVTEAYTEYRWGDDTGVLWLEEMPQDKLSASVVVVSQPYEGGTQTTITDTDDDGYVLRAFPHPVDFNHGYLRRKGNLRWAKNCQYVITYNRGYAAGAEPAAIRGLVADLVALMYADAKAQAGNATAGIGGVTGETLGRYSYTLGGGGSSDGNAMGDRQGRIDSTVNNWRRRIAS